MFDDEFVVLVVNGDGAEALHRTLTEEERRSLIVDDGGFDIFELDIANHDLAESDDCTGTQFAGGHLVVALAFDVLVGEVTVLPHEVGFNGRDGDI